MSLNQNCFVLQDNSTCVVEDNELPKKSKKILELLLHYFSNIKVGEEKEFDNWILSRPWNFSLYFEWNKYKFDLILDDWEININFRNWYKLKFFLSQGYYIVLWKKKLNNIMENWKYFNSEISYYINYNLDWDIINFFDGWTDIELYIRNQIRANLWLWEKYWLDENKKTLNSWLYFNIESDKLILSNENNNIDPRINFIDTSTGKNLNEAEFKNLSQMEQKIPISIKIDWTILELLIPFQEKIIIDFWNVLNEKKGIEIIKKLFEKMWKEKPKIKDKVNSIIDI